MTQKGFEKMKNFILATVAAVVGFVAVQAGEGPAKAQAPAAPAKAQAVKGAACECATVEVARRATLRERRSLVVVEKVPVKVVEVKAVEVKKAASCDCCPATTVAPARRLLGRTRTVVGNDVSCVNCK